MLVQRCRGADEQIQRCRDAEEDQRCRGAAEERMYRGAGVQGCRDAGVQGCRCEMCRCADVL